MKCIYGTKKYLHLILGDFLKTSSPNLKKTGHFFQVSVYFHSHILGRKQQRIGSVHCSGYWQQNYSFMLWSSLMESRLLVV